MGTIFDQCKEREGRAEKKAGQVVFMWRTGQVGRSELMNDRVVWTESHLLSSKASRSVLFWRFVFC